MFLNPTVEFNQGLNNLIRYKNCSVHNLRWFPCYVSKNSENPWIVYNRCGININSCYSCGTNDVYSNIYNLGNVRNCPLPNNGFLDVFFNTFKFSDIDHGWIHPLSSNFKGSFLPLCVRSGNSNTHVSFCWIFCNYNLRVILLNRRTVLKDLVRSEENIYFKRCSRNGFSICSDPILDRSYSGNFQNFYNYSNNYIWSAVNHLVVPVWDGEYVHGNYIILYRSGYGCSVFTHRCSSLLRGNCSSLLLRSGRSRCLKIFNSTWRTDYKYKEHFKRYLSPCWHFENSILCSRFYKCYRNCTANFSGNWRRFWCSPRTLLNFGILCILKEYILTLSGDVRIVHHSGFPILNVVLIDSPVALLEKCRTYSVVDQKWVFCIYLINSRTFLNTCPRCDIIVNSY